MKVYFLRHGIAEEAEEWKGSDFDRPLTGKGRKQLAKVAAAIADLELDLDAIVTSPLVRAKDTAAIAADALEMRDRVVEDPRAATGLNAKALSDILRDHASKTLMLVGHEPSMSETIAEVTGARVDLKKAGLACFELSDAASRDGRLLWLVSPKVLAR